MNERIINGDFSGWLRDAIAARRITQRMVAERTGLHHSTVSRLVRGEFDPKLSTVLLLVAFFEVRA